MHIHFVVRLGLFRGGDCIFKCYSFKALRGLASILGTIRIIFSNYVYVNQSESTSKCSSKLKILPTILYLKRVHNTRELTPPQLIKC